MKQFSWVGLIVLVATCSCVPFAWSQASAICESTSSAVGVFVHPELLPGEKFIDNCTIEQYFQKGYVTSRLGKTAYDNYGHKMADSGLCRPVFVMNDELIQGDKIAQNGEWQITGCRNFHDEKGKLIGRKLRFNQGFGPEKNYYFKFRQEHSSWKKVKDARLHEWVTLKSLPGGDVEVE